MLFNASGTAGGPEAPRPDRGMLQLRQRFMWFDTATGGRLTVDSVLVDYSFYQDPRTSWVVPFTPRSSAATTAEGAFIFITRGRPADILEYDVDGKLRRIFRIEAPGRPVTQEMFDAFIDRESQRRTARFRSMPRSAWYRAYQNVSIPDTLPDFQRLVLDELGWLWAEVYDFDPGRQREWVVFDPDGRARGTVRTPPGLSSGLDATLYWGYGAMRSASSTSTAIA
jgi:hypothetical protein